LHLKKPAYDGLAPLLFGIQVKTKNFYLEAAAAARFVADGHGRTSMAVRHRDWLLSFAKPHLCFAVARQIQAYSASVEKSADDDGAMAGRAGRRL